MHIIRMFGLHDLSKPDNYLTHHRHTSLAPAFTTTVAPGLTRGPLSLLKTNKWMAQASLSAGSQPHLLPGRARYDGGGLGVIE